MLRSENTPHPHRNIRGGGAYPLPDDAQVHEQRSTSDSITPSSSFPLGLTSASLALVSVPLTSGAHSHRYQNQAGPIRKRASSSALPSTSSSSLENRRKTMFKDGVTPTQRISRAKKGKRVHACEHQGCEKIFTRAEHLRRHQLNHSTAVHYTCELCDKTFVRQDLLSRHTERHATQTRKAVQTLALAQRHRQFSNQFSINGITMLAAPSLPPPPPHTHSSGEYGGHPQVFDTISHPHSHSHSSHPPRLLTNDVTAIPHMLSAHHSHPPSPAGMVAQHSNGSMASYGHSYAPSMGMNHPGEQSMDYDSGASTPSPSITIRRPHPFQLQQTEPPRTAGYITAVASHPELPRRSMSFPGTDQNSAIYMRQMSPWDNYAWMFDKLQPDHEVHQFNTAADINSFVHPLEVQHHQSISLTYNTSNDLKTSAPMFHRLTDAVLESLGAIFGNAPEIHEGNANPDALDQYLSNFWVIMHPMFPLLHRGTFRPEDQLNYLVAIVIALGASYGDQEARNFAQVVYHRVRRWILKSDHFTSHNRDSLYIRQLILLTDLYGKTRTPDGDLYGRDLEMLLQSSLEKSPITSEDVLSTVRDFQQEGIQFNFQTEWRAWIELESRKRVALLFFAFSSQQALQFGREMPQTPFDVKVHLPCNGHIWALDTHTEWNNGLDGQPESISYLEALRSYINPRREPQALTPFSASLILYGLIALGLDLQRLQPPGFMVAPSPSDITSKRDKLLRGLELWRRQFDTLLGSILVEPWYHKVLSTYHMGIVVLHTPLKYLLASAGDFRLTRDTSDEIVYRAKQELQMWIASPNYSQLATWHAGQILMRYMDRSELYHHELFHSWLAYVATLVCWAYGQMLPRVPPGLGQDHHHHNHHQQQQQDSIMLWELQQAPHEAASLWLQRMGPPRWQDLIHVNSEYCRRTEAVLMVFGEVLGGSRWRLVKDGGEVLKRITLSSHGGRGKGV